MTTDDLRHPGRHHRARAEGEMNDRDARLWHPWLRINRGRVVGGQGPVQEGSGASERDPARGLVQLAVRDDNERVTVRRR
jgi:hypothetical protein